MKEKSVTSPPPCSILDTSGQPVAGVPLAVWNGKAIAGVFFSNDAGEFEIRTPGKQAILSRAFATADGAMVFEGANLTSAVASSPPPGAYRRIAGLDCLPGSRKVTVTCCGATVQDYPVIAFRQSNAAAFALSSKEGNAIFFDGVDRVYIPPTHTDHLGVVYQYTGSPDLPFTNDLVIEVESLNQTVFLEGLAVNDCGEPLPGICVLLLDENRVLIDKGKTRSDGSFRFEKPGGEYVVFGSEHNEEISKCCMKLITDAIVKANTAAKCGRRVVPTAIYACDCCCCEGDDDSTVIPKVPIPPDLAHRNPQPLRQLAARWQTMREAIAKQLLTATRAEAIQSLEKGLQIVRAQREALDVQEGKKDGLTDKAFVRGSHAILSELAATLSPFGDAFQQMLKFDGGDR